MFYLLDPKCSKFKSSQEMKVLLALLINRMPASWALRRRLTFRDRALWADAFHLSSQ